MSAPKLEMYFDYSSPYAYLGSELVEAVAERHGAELHWTPIVLGGIFQAVGTAPPSNDKIKTGHMFEDLACIAEVKNIPYKKRTTFLIRSILPLRVTLEIPQGQDRARAIHALFRGGWAEDKDLAQPEVVIELMDRAGFDGPALVEGTQQQSIKDELKQNTEAAVARGVFGAPTFFINDSQMFWGHDRLDLIDHYLKMT